MSLSRAAKKIAEYDGEDEYLDARVECAYYGEFGHVHGGPSYDRQLCSCGKAFRAEGK